MPQFFFTRRGRSFRNADDAEFARIVEDRDRELEDYLNTLSGEVAELDSDNSGGGTFDDEHVLTGDPENPPADLAEGQLLWDGVEDVEGDAGPHEHNEYALVEHEHDEYLSLSGGTLTGELRLAGEADLTIASYAQRGLVIDRTAHPNVQGLVELKPSYEEGATTADIKVDDNIVARFRGDKLARFYGDVKVDGAITARSGGDAVDPAITFNGIDGMGIYSNAAGNYMRFGVAGAQRLAIKETVVVVNNDLKVDGKINGTLAFGIAEGIDTQDVLEQAETAIMPVADEGVATADAEILPINEVVTALLLKVKELSARIEELEGA